MIIFIMEFEGEPEMAEAADALVRLVEKAHRDRAPNLTDEERRSVYERILANTQNGVPKKGCFARIASEFNCHFRTVSRIWHRGVESLMMGNVCADVSARKKGALEEKPSKSTFRKRLKPYPSSKGQI